ncbi:MAG: TIM barrel protein [Christensenellales bacterium]
MVLFGPAGNSDSFYAQGHKSTVETFAWITAMGLDAYEYSFGRGVRLGEAMAKKIGAEAAAHHVTLTVHAPYYVNLATEDAQKAENNLRYFVQSATAAKWMGARRVVFHAGTQGTLPREEAFARTRAALKDVIAALDEAGVGDIELCPETMGRAKQIGDVDEVVELCRLDERLVPAVDFGHLHARGRGALNEEADFAAVLDKLEDGLGGYRARRFHVHFSRIEYTAAGEKMHRTYEETDYGPDFEPLARLIVKRRLEPIVICESRGTMAEDAVILKRIYTEALALEG